MNKESTFNRIQSNLKLDLPNNYLKISTIDMHTGGEPLRVILDGFPSLAGNNVLDYRQDCKKRFDHLRRALMFEPRGHADMYGCLIVPPNDDGADFGIIFMHNEGYSTMCGHAVIAISTLAIEMNWKEKQEGENEIVLDAPCGRIISKVIVKNGKIENVLFQNVPSFVIGLDRQIEIDKLGLVSYDLAYGGAFYAYVDMKKHKFPFDLSRNSYQKLIKAGMDIKRAVLEQDREIFHPFEDDLSFLYGTIFTGDAIDNKVDSRNVCIFADGEVDRCPTGSGVSGRMAIHYKRNEIPIGQKMSIESITGSVFQASVLHEDDYGPFKAVVPQVEGNAYITGRHTFLIDPDDPMKEGFILR